MKKSINASAIVIVLLSIAIVAMSFGFATFTSTLNITGNTTVKAASWKVQYKSGSLTAGSNNNLSNDAIKDNTLSLTDWNFKIVLNEPGDTFEYSATIENAGTLDAVLKSVELSTLTADQQKYLTYEFSYTPDGGSTITSAGSYTSALDHDETAIVKVKVKYVLPEDEADLPENDVVLDLWAHLNYEQAA